MEKVPSYIRLKSGLNPSHISDRLKYNPEILELHIDENDMRDSVRLIETIRYLKSLNIKVYLHQPSKYQMRFYDLLTSDSDLLSSFYETAERLVRICDEEQVRCVIHAHYDQTISNKLVDYNSTILLRDRIQEINSFGKSYLLWEDTISGLFSFENRYLLDELVAPLDLRLNVDVSHTFIACKGNHEKLMNVLHATKQYTEYYHLVDSMGIIHDSLPIGQGLINWKQVKPLVREKDFIFEINLEGDHSDCTPMVQGAIYFNSLE